MLKKKVADKFIMDVDWPKMEEYILSHFEANLDINSIDTSMTSEAVHAEVLARKSIAESIASMKAAFSSYRVMDEQEKISFK